MKQGLLIALLLCCGILSAQPYGNEWIDYDQQYYQIAVAEDGLYRIEYTALQAAGIPLASIAPDEFALYARETEQALYISGAEDGSIDPGDYLEFYGMANDAWMDEQLYANPSEMGNPFYSLVNDTIRYFLTWTPGQANLRYGLENDSDFQNYLSPDGLDHTVRFVNAEDYHYGEPLLFNNKVPDYIDHEGWMSERTGKSSATVSRFYLLPTDNKSEAAVGSASCRTVIASASNALSDGANHHIKIFRGANDEVELANLVFSGYESHTINFEIPYGELGATTRLNYTTIDDLGVSSDQFRIAYSEIKYLHSKDLSDLSSYSFSLGANPTQDKYHVDLSGLALSAPIVYTSGDNPYRITGLSADDSFDFLLPDAPGGSSRLHIVDADTPHLVDLVPVGTTGQFTDYSGLGADSAFIIITHPSLLDAAQVYAAYRSNPESDAIVVNVEELYDQFGGGIPKHFIAIRRFCDLALDSWTERPGHLFLMGKSVFLAPQNQTLGARKDPFLYGQNLVPSFGSPGSDLLLTSGLENLSPAAAIPTGRLSALNSTEVLDYLDKVVYNESREPAAWMKNVLHFGGGGEQNEQARFASYLASYEAIIEDTCFGGNVQTFLKTSSVPIEVNLSDSISDFIEEGISLMTFFGHAGGGQFDQSIDEPQNLEWGAHPLVLVNSCFSGDIHQPNHMSTSEQYTILPDKGAIAFIAAVQLGFEGRLNAYSTELYNQISQKNYSKSIGYLMQQVAAELSGGTPLLGEDRASILMNLLQGDPAVKLFSPESPDLAIDQSSVSFSPEIVTATVDTITVRVAVTNIGKATNTPFDVELIREYPDGSQTVYYQNMAGLYYRDTVSFRVATDFANAFGINQFKVSVDLPGDAVAEIDNFLNNRLTVSLPITDGGVFPVLPYEFAIIPDNSVTLKASTGNPFIGMRDYRLQMDTTDLFNSSELLEYSTSQTGGVINWEVPLSLTDSMVYYWRVTELGEPGEDLDWRESSFQYINGRSGWGQAHYFQFKKDRFNNLVYDRPERDFDFFSGNKTLSCKAFGNSTSPQNPGEGFAIDFQNQEYGGCGGTHSFHVAIIDPVTLEPWETQFEGANPDNVFGNNNDGYSCRARPEKYFVFRQDLGVQMSGFEDMIENHVPDGHYILIYTWRGLVPGNLQITFPEWEGFFNDLGASTIADVEEIRPFIYMGVKGDPGASQIVIGDELTSIIELQYDMTVTGNEGAISSPIIGPALDWQTLHWEGQDIAPSDRGELQVVGIADNGAETLIGGTDYDLSVTGQADLSSLGTLADYSYVKLRAVLSDTALLDPIQLDRWQIIYSPVPEAALDPSLGFSFFSDSLQEGQNLELISSIANISDLDMDSLLVHYWVQTASNERIDIPYLRQAPLAAGAVLTDTIVVPSAGLYGNNTLWVEVNPVVTATGLFDQIEQYHFNNIGQLRFNVQEDKENPILDVTFDGHHILDGELISAKPEILIRLDDENPFLIMDEPSDTTFFSVFLTRPNGIEERVYFNNGLAGQQMTFIPADGIDNVADILFSPDLNEDGEYRLMVIASDKSGNASGNINYVIRFKVEHATSISEVLNYPNPFSTRTQFVFTLTGTAVPDYLKIEILTVTGKLVKEIYKEELGDLRIGRNITDYAWDGTDNYGDRLANGVYVYRVITKDQDSDVDVRATGASSFFKKGFGKMYLLR